MKADTPRRTPRQASSPLMTQQWKHFITAVTNSRPWPWSMTLSFNFRRARSAISEDKAKLNGRTDTTNRSITKNHSHRCASRDVNRVIILNAFRLPQTVADSIRRPSETWRRSTAKLRRVSGGVNWSIKIATRERRHVTLSGSDPSIHRDRQTDRQAADGTLHHRILNGKYRSINRRTKERKGWPLMRLRGPSS